MTLCLKGIKVCMHKGCPGMPHGACGRLTGRSLADKEGEITLIIPQLLSSFYMESKSKEEDYLAGVSVSVFLYHWRNCFD